MALEGEMAVVVSDRIILGPDTAKRLLVLLGTILARRELQSEALTDPLASIGSRT